MLRQSHAKVIGSQSEWMVTHPMAKTLYCGGWMDLPEPGQTHFGLELGKRASRQTRLLRSDKETNTDPLRACVDGKCLQGLASSTSCIQ
jgi:hypothetical protein